MLLGFSLQLGTMLLRGGFIQCLLRRLATTAVLCSVIATVIITLGNLI
ncbi:hypothetical protein P288_21510 [Salmonella enterica subsp. arizonae serovar 18:z4,z23:- str. CVM N7307]|nr:hypothetical protein P288_21510 [Salmonella enterica subsp. arizonae serovar 18:z4,z23:- str. CVM N7307]